MEITFGVRHSPGIDRRRISGTRKVPVRRVPAANPSQPRPRCAACTVSTRPANQSESHGNHRGRARDRATAATQLRGRGARRVKFRVARLVYLAFSRDETILGFGCPKQDRAALLATRPDVFLPPDPADERYHWLQLRLAAIDRPELDEFVIDAWQLVVPKSIAAAYLANLS